MTFVQKHIITCKINYERGKKVKNHEGPWYIFLSDASLLGIGACFILIVQQFAFKGCFNALILASEIILSIFFFILRNHIKRRRTLGYMAMRCGTFVTGVLIASPMHTQPFFALIGISVFAFGCYYNIQEEKSATFFWNK